MRMQRVIGGLFGDPLQDTFFAIERDRTSRAHFLCEFSADGEQLCEITLGTTSVRTACVGTSGVVFVATPQELLIVTPRDGAVLSSQIPCIDKLHQVVDGVVAQDVDGSLFRVIGSAETVPLGHCKDLIGISPNEVCQIERHSRSLRMTSSTGQVEHSMCGVEVLSVLWLGASVLIAESRDGLRMFTVPEFAPQCTTASPLNGWHFDTVAPTGTPQVSIAALVHYESGAAMQVYHLLKADGFIQLQFLAALQISPVHKVFCSAGRRLITGGREIYEAQTCRKIAVF